MRDIVIIAHNLRSIHNVGSLLRTAEGLGVRQVILTGYTPYPLQVNDTRLPHLAQKIDRQIVKTALGAEKLVTWKYLFDVEAAIRELTAQKYEIVALEQTSRSIPLADYVPPEKVALVVGREVEGIEPEVLAHCDRIVEIPMFGHKESFNVVQAAAMALYHFRFD